MKEIKITQGKVALVDDEDFYFLNQRKWHAVKSRTMFYAVSTKKNTEKTNSKKGVIHMHRLLLCLSNNDLFPDHIDRNGLNNQKNNLRIATRRNNQHNRISQSGSSIYKGVTWNKKSNKWQSQIGYNGQHKYLGFFNNEIEAALVYNQYAVLYHGEFANLNIIKNNLLLLNY